MGAKRENYFGIVPEEESYFVTKKICFDKILICKT